MSTIYQHDLMAYDGLKILQKDDLFKFSIDSLLLGDFVNINPSAKRIIDLGCGLGPVTFYLTLKTKAKIIGVDIQEDVIKLAKQSSTINQLDDQVEFIQGDIRTIHQQFETNQFDVVVSNPPFYKSKETKQHNDLASLSIARHEIMLNLDDLFTATKRLLSNGGMFYMIHRASRIDEILLKLNDHNFVVKRMRFVYPKPSRPAKMLLIEARLNGAMGSIKVEEPLYIYDEHTSYTKQVQRIFHLGDETYEKDQSLSE